MVSTARMARSRTPNFRCGTGRKNYRNTGNALFTGPFYYINPCIKNVVLIDPACGTAGFLVSASEERNISWHSFVESKGCKCTCN